MAARKPLVLDGSGNWQQLQAGDTLDATTGAKDISTATNDNASSITIGQIVYTKSNGSIDLARANAVGTCDVAGFVAQASISASASGEYQTEGSMTLTTAQWDSVTGQTGGLTPGAAYFLNETTAGHMGTTAPSAGYVVRLGKAHTATEFHINIQPPIKL